MKLFTRSLGICSTIVFLLAGFRLLMISSVSGSSIAGNFYYGLGVMSLGFALLSGGLVILLQKKSRKFNTSYEKIGTLFLNQFNKDKEKAFNYIESVPDFKCTQKEIGVNILHRINKAIAIDEENRNIMLVSIKNSKYKHRIILFENIFSSEIIEDEASVEKYSKSGVIIGGVIAGVQEAANVKSSNYKIKKLGLKIVVESLLDPEFILYKINSLHSINKNSVNYNTSRIITHKWNDMITTAIKRGQTDQYLDEIVDMGIDKGVLELAKNKKLWN